MTTETTEFWTVERPALGEIKRFATQDAWIAWMQNHAIRKSDGTERMPDVGITPDGKRWLQVGYVLLAE